MGCIWKIEGKGEVIRLGDATTHGGKVITASTNAFYDGIPIARVGDQVSCPKCAGTHTIVTGAPHAFDHGAAIACHGDLVSCGARLIARNWTGTLPGDTAVSSPESENYREDFQIICDGAPLTGMPYTILVEGKSAVSGDTDGSGKTVLSGDESRKKVELCVNQSLPPKIA